MRQACVYCDLHIGISMWDSNSIDVEQSNRYSCFVVKQLSNYLI